MIVLLPVSKFRVPYDLARGKPYSRLEHMVLNAIADGGATLRSLAEAFRVHDRLLVQAVVTLVNAGWVAVQGGPQASFVLTGAGHVAATGNREPVSVIVETARPGIVVMERHSGQVARQSEARPYRRDDLTEVWDAASRIGTRVVRDSVDEAQVQKLLHREAGEWVRRIGRIEEISRDAHWLPLDVDIDAKQVLGLPPPWRHALTAPALAAAAAAVARFPRTPATPRGTGRPARRRFLGVTNDERVHQRGTSVLLAADDVLRGGHAHATALAQALQSAQTSVALAIPRLDGSEVFEALAAGCADAVARGVRVDLLIGSTDGDPADLKAIANRIGYGADARHGRALLRTRVTGSGASLLLWDSAPGQLVGVVTSHAWVGQTEGSSQSAGVRVLSPALCADLARAVASLWTGRSGDDFTGEPLRWRHLADKVEERAALSLDAAVNVTATTAELLVDEECLAMDDVQASDAAVGLYVPDPAGGDVGRRGVQLIVCGPGAQLVRATPDPPG
ncbi:hypothetical protein MUY14_06910 [Amycolatopsis sp. FBCC-B4732]|uniref:hypothetical protein n=1 Tax=Amycolatopsis sp. FBCC-B4732 TaxID=3079339 RepID=UPI001FF1B684|nr:hypothetical protein [Amycolatopsis sp. FBCC-B4732]UOX90349.1 hypothetical protein MUY14_06910 [Amycolatopsis sp. FBCC-B4732]